MPYIDDWNQKYSNKGLVIVGVHSPEFTFEKNYANVKDAVQRCGITYPVILDSDHGTWNAYAKLAPEGGSLIHVAEHLGSWIEPKPREDQQELEELLDLMQPGWRQVIIKKRPLPNMLVSNAVVTAASGGLAGRPDEKIGDNLYIVGDWVGKEGLLSNASFASAKRAADLILDA
jgi:hypothetical protein